jgi:hypothetical protein
VTVTSVSVSFGINILTGVSALDGVERRLALRVTTAVVCARPDDAHNNRPTQQNSPFTRSIAAPFTSAPLLNWETIRHHR